MLKRKLRVKKTIVRSLTRKQAGLARAGWNGWSSWNSAGGGPGGCPIAVTITAACNTCQHTCVDTADCP